VVIRRALLAAALVLALMPAGAQAHALLERTQPQRGAELEAPPPRVAFYFSEPVEASFGAVRVFDTEGGQVEVGEITRPQGRSDAVAVSLDPDLPDGTYTATYRVISADSHPVSGGFVFTVGEPGAVAAKTVSELLEDSDSGPVTSVAYWAARWLGYASIGLAIGALGFLLAVWRPALREAGGAEPRWTEASGAFAGRVRALLAATVAVGLVTSLAMLGLQGATATGGSFWSALDPDVVGDLVETRFGGLMALRAVAWAVLGLALLIAGARMVPVLRPVRLGATGTAPSSTLRPVAITVIAAPLAFLAASPALAGHARTQSPELLLFPANVVHVSAMSLWIGGLALLVLAVPAATGRLEAPQKSQLLAANLLRFSPLALGAVIALAATGVTQSIVYLGAIDDLIDTAFGRAVLIKATLLSVLVGLGALNRRRLLPGLTGIVKRRGSPGRTGQILARTLRAEVALIVAVVGVTAALVSYAPPSEAGAGPVSGSATLGPALLEYTVEPAEVGRNQVHLYLFDAGDGSQLADAREVALNLTLPSEGIGPLDADLERAGPGHYVAPGAPFGVAGDWTMTVSLRTSRFDLAQTELEVPIE
jgi:copper transport protein